MAVRDYALADLDVLGHFWTIYVSIEDWFLQITWDKKDDFSVHYQEHRAHGEEQKHRWD
jgi:hypothetical protein